MTEQCWKNIAYDTMPGGMVKFLVDDPLTILECNPKFCQMTDFSKEEMIQNGLLHYCDPLDVEFVHRSIRTQAKEQKSLHLEFRFKIWNGSLVWYQMSGSYIGIKDDCAVYVCSLFDVTESHILQSKLRENLRVLQAKQDEINELYHTVISGFAKVAADEWYTLLFANDRLFELVGYTRYQVKTMFNNEAGRLVHPRDLESFRTIINSMNGSGRFSTKFRLLHRDGTFSWIRLDGTFVNKFHGDVPVFYCFYTDIDEQKEQETALQRQQYFTSLVTSSIAGGLTIFYNRPNWPIAYISESLLELLGYSEEEFQKKVQGNLRNIVYPEDLKRVEQEFALQCTENSESYELEFRVKKKDDSIIWVLEKGRQTKDENDEALYVSMYMDITERKNRTDDLVHKSTHDSLTKLFNRAYTRQSIESYLNAHGDKHSSALLLLDLDNFKQVNDAYGHMEGDRVLIGIGELLQDTFLSKDIIGRMGGDEFLVFLKEIHSKNILRSKAQIICDTIKNLNPEKYKGLSASIGIAYVSEQVITYEELVQSADLAMYQAKFNGKNSWYLHCAHSDPALKTSDYFDPALKTSDYFTPPLTAPKDHTGQIDLNANFDWILSKACDGIAAVDLTTGQYTKSVFNKIGDFGTPTYGNYAETFPVILHRDIFPADQNALWEVGELNHLRKAYKDGIKEQSCQYRLCLEDGSYCWIEERFYLTSKQDTPMAFILMRSVSEAERERLMQSEFSSYQSAFWDSFTTKIELNLTTKRYTLLQNLDRDFLTVPEEGSLNTIVSLFSEIIHPAYNERCFQFFQLDEYLPRSIQQTEPVIETLLCQMKDGIYHHLCCVTIPTHSSDQEHLLLLAFTDTEKQHTNLSANAESAFENQFLDSERYHLALKQSGLLVFDWHVEKNSVYYTPSTQQFLFLEFPADQIKSKMQQGQGTHPEDWKLIQELLDNILYSSLTNVEQTLRLACKGGIFLWCKIAVSIVRDEEGKPFRILGTVTDMNDTVQFKKQLEYKERHDPLTGLCNYAYYQERVMQALTPASDKKYCLSYSDIKNFKYINDIYGYEAGNRLLQFISNTLSQVVVSSAIVGRLASDRVSVFREYTDQEALEASFEQYAACLLSYRDTLTLEPLKIEVACGFYCIDTPSDIAPFHDMINRANIAQKSIKEMGGSRCAFYSKELRDRVIQEKEWELSLLNALEKKEFVVYLQPQVSIQNGTEIMGSEALVRWQRSDGILVPPLEFIPLFEKTGGILHLDYYVFECVCRYLHERIQEKKLVYQVSVNVSRVTMTDPLFTEKYCLLKAKYEIPDHILVLECTETAIIADLAQFQIILKTLRSHGFLVAMDDFGTGYSSLNLLRNIDIDILKLDMGFFRGRENPLKSDAIISGVFNIARALNLHTLAEGIESMTLVETLRGYGCDSVQGYVFSKPRPMDEFDRAITEIISETSKTSACREETIKKKITD